MANNRDGVPEEVDDVDEVDDLDEIEDPVELAHRLDLMPVRQLMEITDVSEADRVAALRRRTKITLCIGSEAVLYCLNSKLWYPFQNYLSVFKESWFDSLEPHYVGLPLEWIDDAVVNNFCRLFPLVTSLAIIVDLSSVQVERRQGTIANLEVLLKSIGPGLDTLQLWIKCEPVRVGGHWKSDLRNISLWSSLHFMTSLRTLWLELAEKFPIDAGDDRFETMAILFPRVDTFHRMAQLEDVRLSSDCLDPVGLVVSRLIDCPRLDTVHLLYCKHYHDWMSLPRRFVPILREISVDFSMTHAGQLQNFCTNFHGLTRMEVYLLAGGPRLLDLLLGLANIPNLMILSTILQQSELFNEDERARLKSNSVSLPPLPKLRAISIQLLIDHNTCESFSIRALFDQHKYEGRRHDSEAPHVGGHQARHSLPELAAFEVEVSSGSCARHATSSYCLRKKIYRWLSPLPKMQVVRYLNMATPERDVEKLVERNGIRPERWSDL